MVIKEKDLSFLMRGIEFRLLNSMIILIVLIYHNN
jgi:hypothetical protein